MKDFDSKSSMLLNLILFIFSIALSACSGDDDGAESHQMIDEKRLSSPATEASIRKLFDIPNDVANTVDAKTIEDAVRAIIDAHGDPSDREWWENYDEKLSETTGVPLDQINKGDLTLQDLVERAGVITGLGEDPSDEEWWQDFAGKVGEKIGIPGNLTNRYPLEDLLNAKGIIQGIGADEGKAGVWEGALGVVNAGKTGNKKTVTDQLDAFYDEFGAEGGGFNGAGLGSGDGADTGSDDNNTGSPGLDSSDTSTNFPNLEASGSRSAGSPGGLDLPNAGGGTEMPNNNAPVESDDGGVGGDLGAQNPQDNGDQTGMPGSTQSPQNNEEQPGGVWSGESTVTHNADGSWTAVTTVTNTETNQTYTSTQTFTKQEDGTYKDEHGNTTDTKPEEGNRPVTTDENGEPFVITETNEGESGGNEGSGDDEPDESESDESADSGSDDESESDESTDSESDDASESDNSGSNDKATPDPEGSSSPHTGPALTQKDMEMIVREYMERKGMAVNKNPSELKENGFSITVDRVAPYARPTEESSSGSEDFSGMGNQGLPDNLVDSLVDPDEPDLEGSTGRPNPPEGTGGEVPVN